MSDQDVRDQLMSLIVAGHETTGSALAWALERLLRTPSALHRLRAEVAAGQDGYAAAVCKEALRLRPVVPVVWRRLQEPTLIAAGVFLRALSWRPASTSSTVARTSTPN